MDMDIEDAGRKVRRARLEEDASLKSLEALDARHYPLLSQYEAYSKFSQVVESPRSAYDEYVDQ